MKQEQSEMPCCDSSARGMIHLNGHTYTLCEKCAGILELCERVIRANTTTEAVGFWLDSKK